NKIAIAKRVTTTTTNDGNSFCCATQTGSAIFWRSGQRLGGRNHVGEPTRRFGADTGLADRPAATCRPGSQTDWTHGTRSGNRARVPARASAEESSSRFRRIELSLEVVLMPQECTPSQDHS